MNFKSILILFLLSQCPQLGFCIDEKNEDYFHSIYQKFHSQPTPQDVWESALAKRTSQEYTVVAGDTLWDVSRTLFTDGFFWSKIWALNPYITNPHQIKVGQVIHFYPGEGLDAPSLNVKPPTALPALTPQTSIAQSKWWTSQVMPSVKLNAGDPIPSPLKNYSKALDEFPPSLPNWYFDTDSEVEKAPLEIMPAPQHQITNILNIPYYISEFDQDVRGTVYEIEKNAKTASERDYIFIDADAALKIGSTYTVIQSIGSIKDPEAVGELPKSYEVQGEIKIVGRVESYYKALVTLALFPIQIGASIVPGTGPRMNLSDPGEKVSLKAMIVGGENDTTRSLFGPQSIVYINRGSSDGVKVNQRAPVSAIHRLRHSESTIFANTWKIGEVKIVKVEKNYSTAVVMLATEGIMPGDIVGELHASDITEKFKLLDSNTEFGDAFENDLNKKVEKKQRDEAPVIDDSTEDNGAEKGSLQKGEIDSGLGNENENDLENELN